MRQFYNPDLTQPQIEALDWLNYLALQTVQAFLGSISPDVLALAVEPRNGAVNVHVALRGTAEVRDELLADALGDLDVLLDGKVLIDHTISYGWPDVHEWQTNGLRLVYLRIAD